MSLILDDRIKTFFSTKLNKISLKSIKSVLDLVEEGATVPFIARYRKERTGNLDEVQIRDIVHASETWQELVKRKDFVLQEITKQGNLTSELEKQLTECFEMAELEELYRPYKRKKKTKATIAREAGIEPLADWIWQLGHGEIESPTSLEVKAKDFLKADAGFATYDLVLSGAQHIIVDRLNNMADLRALVKTEYNDNAKIETTKGLKYKDKSKFEMYAEYSEPVKNLNSEKTSHRYLALRRGWQENQLKVKVTANDEKLLTAFEQAAVTNESSQAKSFLKFCAKTSLTVHVIPSVVNELHRVLKEAADEHAILVFAENVKKVLMASPFGSKVVLGVDPGIRTGCKIALIDSTGNYISDTVLHTQGESAKANAKKLLSEVSNQITLEAIAVGNGTAGRETEKFFREVLIELKLNTPVVLVNESGASIYSASDVAREEFPALDLTVRGAISIARRLQDPLAELVKIDPKSIGVGQYQHDVSQSYLKKSLHEVVESCVNNVGVNLNTASHSLLQYVSGIGPALAKNIMQYRKDNGQFTTRNDLLKVSSFSSKVFEQSAGFLRIPDRNVALDATGIHPERYQAVNDMAKESSVTVTQLMGNAAKTLNKEKWSDIIGEFTFNDIVKELDSKVRDPRDAYKVFKFKEDIHQVKDLKEGMLCPGVVTNVTNFGAFVDVGVHQDGLVHISELSHEFINDPKLVVSPGDQVQVKVLKVDVEKSQISFSMLIGEKPKAPVKSVRKAKVGNKSVAAKGKKLNPKKDSKAKPQNERSRPYKPKKPTFGNSPFADLATQLKK